jgi:hypothetical protein
MRKLRMKKSDKRKKKNVSANFHRLKVEISLMSISNEHTFESSS